MLEPDLDIDFAEMATGVLAKPPAGRAHVERSEPRTETNLIAMIRLSDGTEIPCIVKDVSKSGAKIGVPAGRMLPERFLFKLNGRDLVFQARLAWQREHYAGVRIERIAKLPAAAAAQA